MQSNPKPPLLLRSLAALALTALSLLTRCPQALAQTGSGGKEGSIEHCERNLGTLAVAEPQSHMLASLGQFKLGSPATMLRMIAQESNCFTVVERGVGMQNIQQERALSANGMLRQDANVGGGQLQAADFVLTPSLQFSDNTGGVGGAIGGLLGRFGGALGALGGLAGGLKFKEAETTLLLADVRSGIQVASAEGQASKMDFSLSGWGWGGLGWASAGGYAKTPEGKLLAASLLDNFNRIVQQVRNKPALVQASSASSQANSQASAQATPLSPAMAQTPLPIQPPMAMPAPPMVAPSAAAMRANAAAIQRAAGMYGGQLHGVLEGPMTLMMSPQGDVVGSVHLKDQQVMTLSGKVSTPQGDFMLSGAHPMGAVMMLGKIDSQNALAQGNWFISNSASAAPIPGGSFALKR